MNLYEKKQGCQNESAWDLSDLTNKKTKNNNKKYLTGPTLSRAWKKLSPSGIVEYLW